VQLSPIFAWTLPKTIINLLRTGMNHFIMRLNFLKLLFLLVSTAQAQEQCGTMRWLEQMQVSNPGVKAQWEALNRESANWIEAHQHSLTSRSVVTIPVVVHVVYNTSEQNISDEQIFSQIQVLNDDYRRLNADRSNTPSIFQNVAADCEIEFCLARQDPQGNATTGITRTQTQAQVFQMGNAMKRTETGGKAAWDSNKYLNIWVCNLNPGLLGYASLPGTELPAFDGVVIGYKSFGKGGATVPPYNLGRTATHEVGHWLNLQHIWGDNDGSDPCSGTDEVADTPNQARQNEGCPDFPQPSCNNTSDMFMNYMDYTRDVCMNLFTLGQKARMHASLNGPRKGILSSQACMEPIIKPDCDTITNANSPDGLVFYLVEELTDEGKGFLIGHNSFRDHAFADYIPNAGEKSVSRLLFDFARADFGTPQDSIKAFICSAGMDGPGAELASVKLAIPDIAENIDQFRFTEAVFEPGVTVNGSFYAGFEIEYQPGDSVGIYSTQFDETSIGNCWFRDSSGAWYSYEDSYEIAISMGVYADLCSTVSLPDVAGIPGNLVLFPNPADQYISVVYPGKSFVWEILSIDGRYLQGGRSDGKDQLTLPVADLINGMYLFRLRTDQGYLLSKFIIQH
jgi:hypothetical protein